MKNSWKNFSILKIYMLLNCKRAFILLFLTLAVYSQEQQRVAILNTVDDSKPELDFTELTYLTNKLREIAVKILPENKYFVMTSQSIIEMLGTERKEECKNKCLLDMGKAISTDYIGQARLGRLGGNYAITMELYNVVRGNLIGSFTGNAKDVFGLVAVIDKNAPIMFRKMPGVSSNRIIEEGIGRLSKSEDYKLDEEKLYLVNLSSEPSGAVLSFDGVPNAKCPKTPCRLELHEGAVRIIANLEQYEIADTIVSVARKNQNIAIKLKPNFGILEIKPAYLDGIGNESQWSLSINRKSYSLGEIRLPPNEYSVKLNHECYENINFDAGINKGKRAAFDMASNITLKKGGLVLSAELDGEPISEPVFVNGKQVGETPFSGAVPLCAKVEIGKNRETVGVKLRYNEKVNFTYKNKLYENKSGGWDSFKAWFGWNSFKDPRDNRIYKTVKIGSQTWMAENLNYEATRSKCSDNDPANCKKYGRLYNWYSAIEVCPDNWHLPNNEEWYALKTDKETAGKYFKATSDNSDGYPYWWSSNNDYTSAYCWFLSNDYENGSWNFCNKYDLLSVRCVQGSLPEQENYTNYSSESYESNYSIKRIEGYEDNFLKDGHFSFAEIGWQRIYDMNHLRMSADWFYFTVGLSGYWENEYEEGQIENVEFIMGLIHRFVWEHSNFVSFGFGLFGGLGLRQTNTELSGKEENFMRHELGIEFILGYISLYIAERDFKRIGGGIGLIF